ncbi:MAG: hypothetical protein ACOYKC_05265 [Anaerolineaceae bacterium]|jgi:hypothetical protein
MRNPYRHVIHQAKFIFIIILFLLSSCNQAVAPVDTSPTHSQAQSPTQVPATATPSHTPTVTNTATPSPSPTPTPQPEIDPQEFDYSLIDLMNWEGDLTVESKEELEKGYIVKVREGYKTLLYTTPLFSEDRDDNFLQYGIVNIDIPEGFKFELQEIKKIVGEDGQSVTVGVLRNGTGLTASRGVQSIVLSAEDEEGGMINFTEKTEEDKSMFSYVDFFGYTHLKDHQAGALLLRNLLEYQKENGPFVSGQQYSLKEVADMYSEEFDRLFHYPDGSNLGLSDVMSGLTWFLTEENNVATRTPRKVSTTIVPVININTKYIWGERYGVFAMRSDNPENDSILTFKKGPNGEEEYYIGGDVLAINHHLYISFYLTDNIDDIDISIAEANEVYEDLVNWDRTNHVFTEEEENETRRYLLGISKEDEIKKIDAIIEAIYPARNKSFFFRGR